MDLVEQRIVCMLDSQGLYSGLGGNTGGHAGKGDMESIRLKHKRGLEDYQSKKIKRGFGEYQTKRDLKSIRLKGTCNLSDHRLKTAPTDGNCKVLAFINLAIFSIKRVGKLMGGCGTN